MYLTNNLKIGLLVAIFSLYSSQLFAQEEKSDCLIKLEQAQGKYDQGRIQDVEPLIGKCLKGKEFDKAERTQALRLLTLTYLFLEEPEKAENTMLELLETSHEFAVNPAIDPSEFINLYNKYRHDPLFSVGFLGGIVAVSPIITQLNSTQDLNNNSRQTYTPKIGFRFAFNGEYKLMDKLYVNAGIGYQSVMFQKSNQSLKIISNTDNGGFKAEETQTAIEVPVLGQYHIIENNNFTIYGAVGFSPQYLIAASHPGDAITYGVDGSADVTSNTINLTADRNRFNIAAMGVAGLKIKFGEGFFNTQIRYSHQLLKSSKPNNSLNPNDPNLLWDLAEAYDGFRLQDIGFSIGYTLHIYQPKKLR